MGAGDSKIVKDISYGDETYFTYAYSLTIEKILKRLPDAQILLVIEPYIDCYDAEPEWGGLYNDLIDCTEYVAEQYKLPILNLFAESGIDANNISNLTKDGTHPTNEADKILMKLIVEKLLEIQP